MKTLCCPFWGVGAAAALFVCLGASQPTDNETEVVRLSHKAIPKWTINLPNETFSPVTGVIPVPHQLGAGFAATTDGTALAVDTNGDGKPDAKAKGTSGFLTLKAGDVNYSIRLVNEGGWKFSTGGVQSGSIKGEQIRLIDQNNNGVYNEFGIDAMIVGAGSAASFLSKVVNLGGSLFNLDVNAEGTEVSVSPYVGETGTLNLRANFDTNGKLESAVVANEDKTISFNVADARKGLAVPIGEYRVVHGFVTMGAESVRIKTGRMNALRVDPGKELAPTWGGPLKAEFTYTHENDTLTIRPTDLFFFGKAGEEYANWIPDGAPPKFIVKDAKTGREITTARFGGC